MRNRIEWVLLTLLLVVSIATAGFLATEFITHMPVIWNF